MSDTKNKIMEAMYNLIEEKGYDKTSLNNISDVVGVKKPTIYHYFDGKEDILLSMMDEYVSYMYDSLEDYKQVLTIGEFKLYMLRFGENLIKSSSEDLKYRKIIAEIEIQSSRIPAVEVKLQKLDQQFEEGITELVSHAETLGALKLHDRNQAIEAILFFVNGMDSSLTQGKKYDYHKLWSHLVTGLFM